jgi:hypothetical protein
MKIYLILFSLLAVQAGTLVSPVVYDNFEGNKQLSYGNKNPTLDTASVNPHPDDVNSSVKCAKYTRNSSKKFDNIKMAFSGTLEDVSAYATYLGVPPKLKMKIYTNAPVGTLVEILLGSRGRNTEYPAGTHSQYQAHTTKKNAWEELEFKFAQIPEGSETSAIQIDQLTLLFDPNSGSSDTYYFDDITGPVLRK